MEGIREALETRDPPALVAAIDRAALHLRNGVGTGPEATAIGDAIAAHAQHARSSVRQAVAHAALHLPDAAFEAVITVLLADANKYVKRAATHSYDERSRRARVVRDQVAQSEGIRTLRARIARDCGPGGLRLADRLAELTAAQFVDGLVHEAVKVVDPLRASLVDLGAEGMRIGARGADLVKGADGAQARSVLLIDILKSARLQVAVTAPRYRDTALRDVVEEQLGLVRDRLDPERRARLRVTIDVEPAVTVDCDRVLLGQAIANVFQNAVEAYRAAGDEPIAITVKARHEKAGTLVALDVSDAGRGIEAETLARLGAPFESSNGPGRGLGVANIKRMVEVVHGGAVHVESEVGRGTTVSLHLPRKQQAVAATKVKRK